MFAEVATMPSSFVVRARIAELEEKEKRLYSEDRLYWENPEHTQGAQLTYARRREQIRRIRQELQDLHRDLAVEMVRPVKR
jgi:hypothetical protein